MNSLKKKYSHVAKTKVKFTINNPPPPKEHNLVLLNFNYWYQNKVNLLKT